MLGETQSDGSADFDRGFLRFHLLDFHRAGWLFFDDDEFFIDDQSVSELLLLDHECGEFVVMLGGLFVDGLEVFIAGVAFVKVGSCLGEAFVEGGKSMFERSDCAERRVSAVAGVARIS